MTQFETGNAASDLYPAHLWHLLHSIVCGPAQKEWMAGGRRTGTKRLQDRGVGHNEGFQHIVSGFQHID